MKVTVNNTTVNEASKYVKESLKALNKRFKCKDFKVHTNDLSTLIESVIQTSDTKLSITQGNNNAASIYFNVTENGALNLVFSSFNATRKDEIKEFSKLVHSTDITDGYFDFDTEVMNDLNGNSDAENAAQTLREVIALKSLSDTTLISSQDYWTNKGFTKQQLERITQCNLVFVTKTSTKFPLYDVLGAFNEGKDLSFEADIKSIYTISTSNDVVNKNYSLPGYASTYFNNATSNTLIIVEGVSTAITATLMAPNASVLGIGSITNAKRAGSALEIFLSSEEGKRYNNVLCAFDNDNDSELNVGRENMYNHIYIPLLKNSNVKASCAMFDEYVTSCVDLPSDSSFDLDDVRMKAGIDTLINAYNNVTYNQTHNDHVTSTTSKLVSRRNGKLVKDIINLTNITSSLAKASTIVTDIFNKNSRLHSDLNRLHAIIIACMRLSQHGIAPIFANSTNTINLETIKYDNFGIPKMDPIKDITNESLSFYVAPMGAGKSNNVLLPLLIRSMGLNKRVIIVVPSVALVDSTLAKYAHLGAVSYKTSIANKNMDTDPLVVTTIDSVHKFLNKCVNTDIIIDEVHEVNDLIGSPSRVHNKTKTLKALSNVVNTGGKISCISADVSHGVVEFLKTIVGVSNAHITIFGSVYETPQEVLPVSVTDKLGDIYMDTELAISNGENIYYCTDSKKESERYAAFIMAMGISVKVINSKTKDSSLMRPDIIDKDYRVVIATPSVSSGVSLSTTKRTVFGSYFGTITTTDMIQLLNRVRKRTSVKVADLNTLTEARANTLKKETTKFTYAINRSLIDDTTLLTLLNARNTMQADDSLSLTSQLQNTGYKKLSVGSYLSNGDITVTEYKNYQKEVNLMLEAQFEKYKLEEFQRYEKIAATLDEQSVNEIIAGTKRTDDEISVAATLKHLDIMTLDGVKAIDDGLTRIAHITCLINDKDGMVASLYDARNKEFSLDKYNYSALGSLLRDFENTFSKGRMDVGLEKLEAIISEQFDSLEELNVFRATILGPLNITINVLNAAIKYEGGKEKIVSHLTDAIMSKLGCSISRKDYVVTKKYQKEVANINENMYNTVVGSITQDDYFASLDDSLEIIQNVSTDVLDTSGYDRWDF